MKISSKKIKYIFLSVLSIILLFRPRVLALYSGISTLFYSMQFLLVLAMVFLMVRQILKKGLKKSFSPISYLVIVYKLYEMVAASINGVFEISTIVNAGVIISATVFADYLLTKAPEEYLGVLSLYTGLLVFVNNMSFFTMGSSSFTDATGNYIYFWSTRNHLSSLFFITFISSILFYGIKRTNPAHLWCMFTVVNVFWGTIMFNSSTTIVGVTVLLILYFLFKKRNVLYRPVLWFFGGVGLNITIVMFRIQEVFAWLIENLLHKTVTLSGRTSIWDIALLYIYRSPIWGYGESSILSFSFAKTEIPAHNQFLDIAIICGIPGVILFGIILFVTFRKLGSYKESFVSRLITCALLGYIVMSISESPNPYQPWFILFAVAFRTPEIERLYTNVAYKLTREFKLRKKITRNSFQN